MRELIHVRQAVYNQPWLIAEPKLEALCEVVERALLNEAAAAPDMNSAHPELEQAGDATIIPVRGIISRRMNLFSRISGGTSIELLDEMLDTALADNSTRIILHIDSPGGGVPGTPEFATRVFKARQHKTIIALADGIAASAAYWIGSQADEFYVTEASEVGSIGVIAKLLDPTRRMANEGVDSHIIRSSELKAAGMGPLTPSQTAAIQGQVNRIAGMFMDSVMKARPMIDLEGKDPGSLWIGQDAVDIGLADGVSTLEELIDS